MRRHFVILTYWGCLSSMLVSACAPQEAGRTGAAAGGQVLTIGDMTWPDIDALNREKTLFLLPVGMLEEHGPHLPIAADTIGVEYEAERVADRLTQTLPDWNIVLMPAVNYGSSGANQIGNAAVHPGTYRSSTVHSPIAGRGYRRANRAESLQVGFRHEWSWSSDTPYRRQRSVRFRQ